GSPFVPGVNTANILDSEAKLVTMCAKLFGADPDDVDGYVATGSSESNACAVRWAGEKFPNAPFIGGASVHYSITRAVKVVGRELLQVEAEKGGAMDMDALAHVLAECKGRGVCEVIVMLVCGTTMGEGHDNIDAAIAQLDAAGYDRKHRYIHVDSAYSGFILPFLEGVDPGIRVDFRRQGLSSCSASLHKALGTSAPASVFLITKSIPKATFYEYVQTTDVTLSCSRNGHPAFEGWAMLTHILGTGRERWSARWQQGVSMAAQFATNLKEAGVVNVSHNESSVTVLFPEPSKLLVVRYSLVCQDGRAEIMFNFHNLDGKASNLFFAEYLEWY
ncbi:unnamed protein product, partial [Pylaiella littoralis]